MKVGIPTEGKKGMDEQVSPHFGRAPTYTIVDTESGAVEVVENTSDHMGGRGTPVDLLHGNNVQEVLCSNLGRHALEMLQEKGITAYSGAQGTVREAMNLWKEKKISPASPTGCCIGGEHHHSYHHNDNPRHCHGHH